MQNDSSEVSFCPSFSIYSSDNNKLIDIAAKVSRDLKNDDVSDDEEFEFANNPSENPETSSSFPIFNRDDDGGGDDHDDVEGAIGIPLRNLITGHGDIPSSSSSEADELEGLPSDTYCVWKPKQSPKSSPNTCKKSKSTGSSSKRWRFLKDLLKRSNSDGNVSSSSFLFSNFHKNEEKAGVKTAKATNKKAIEMKGSVKTSVDEGFMVSNKKELKGDKRRSYLPYRQDLIGIFANVKVSSRNFPSFSEK